MTDPGARPVLELARFRVVAGAEDALLAERAGVVEAMRNRFPGLLAAYLVREDDGGWLDVVLWTDREAAESAAAHIMEVREFAHWARLMESSDGVRHAEVYDAWPSLPAASFSDL